MCDLIRKCLTAAIIVLIFAGLLAPEGEELVTNAARTSVSFNGTFTPDASRADGRAQSKDGRFWCRYDIAHVGDEVRELSSFELFENDRLLFTMDQAPGSDLYISNSGITAFMDMDRHCREELTINFYSKYGQHLLSKTFKRANLFGFSPKGDAFGVGTTKEFSIVSFPDCKIQTYPKCYQFDISEDGKLVAIASADGAQVYSQGELVREFNTGYTHTRKIRMSSESNVLAVIDKKRIKVYSLTDGDLVFADSLQGGRSYRDLSLTDGQIIAGVQHRHNNHSKGSLRVYNSEGELLIERDGAEKYLRTMRRLDKSQSSVQAYDEIPWPFAPFDSMCTIWNYYEQHMSDGTPEWSYLHQGLDIITPIGEPTYAVAEGIVKCVLTLGGDIYWRTAISSEQTAGFSRGWLYAHLIENTIAFDVGDTVELHDYVGDIIEWHDDWGHIHFVEIEDSGLVWRYDDNEWGITYNPLLSLQPDTDFIPPVIEDVFGHSKFAFCVNETTSYLDPDSLHGDVDIIVKITDYVGDSEWQQPAYETYYSVKRIPEGDTVFPRTLGQVLNHAYDSYGSEHYQSYAPLIYKKDELLLPPMWMDTLRDYYHILTNNNGDSLLDLSEDQLAFFTTDYPDGRYRIVVEAFDAYGNSAVDSMDVRFRNWICGDCNGDSCINWIDIFHLLEYIYAAGTPPKGDADVNQDTQVGVADAVYLLNYLYKGGPAPCGQPSPVCSPTLSPDDTLEIGLSAISCTTGAISVPVTLKNSSTVIGMTFALEYDTNFVVCDSAVFNGNLFGEYFYEAPFWLTWPTTIDSVAGTILMTVHTFYLTGSSQEKLPPGAYPVATLWFSSRVDSMLASDTLSLMDTTFILPSNSLSLVDTNQTLLTPTISMGGFDIVRHCGDCNGDGRVTVADANYIVGYIYRNGPQIACECDVNLDARITVADASYLVSYIYRAGPPPCNPGVEK
jgi:hypothetical protein